MQKAEISTAGSTFTKEISTISGMIEEQRNYDIVKFKKKQDSIFNKSFQLPLINKGSASEKKPKHKTIDEEINGIKIKRPSILEEFLNKIQNEPIQSEGMANFVRKQKNLTAMMAKQKESSERVR